MHFNNVSLFRAVKIAVMVSNSYIIRAKIRIYGFIVLGDSGGALYIYDSNLSKYTAVGIVSKGAGCAVPGSPG